MELLRKILLLQGPVGPFFNQFQISLSKHRLISTQILFNSGDCLFSRNNKSAIKFKGNLENWNNAHTAIVANDLDFIKSARNRDLNKSPLLINYLRLILL